MNREIENVGGVWPSTVEKFSLITIYLGILYIGRVYSYIQREDADVYRVQEITVGSSHPGCNFCVGI